MHAPTENSMRVAKETVRYLQYSKKFKLVYSTEQLSDLDLSDYENYVTELPTAFCDANWDAPKSVSCNLIMWMNAAVIWSVSAQESTALSSVESELVSLSDMAREVKYIRKIFEDLGITITSPTTIFCDSKGAVQNAKHPVSKRKLKHVDIKHFFVRECVERFIVVVHKIATDFNPSDIGTKALGKIKFSTFANFVLNGRYNIKGRVK
jgi:hypothetical protein